MTTGNSTPPEPLFVGGTGRSGTHALARVLGRHGHYLPLKFELKFHADPPGLQELLAGKMTLRKFLRRLQGKWWKQSIDGREAGLHQIASEGVFRQAVSSFETTFPKDPFGASAALLRSLLDPLAEEAGYPAWIENTNRNVAAAPMLLKMFPDAKIIHIVRDGRDSAASLVHKHWAPNTLERSLKWWEDRLRSTERGAAQIPPDRLLVISFEDFVLRDREGSYARLLEFTSLPDSESMRRYFANRTSPDEANIGRWQEGLGERQRSRIVKRYAQALERLIALDTPGRPLFERALAALDD